MKDQKKYPISQVAYLPDEGDDTKKWSEIEAVNYFENELTPELFDSDYHYMEFFLGENETIIAKKGKYTLIRIDYDDGFEPFFDIIKEITREEHLRDIVKKGRKHKVFSYDGCYPRHALNLTEDEYSAVCC